jgi:hypothetical protein
MDGFSVAFLQSCWEVIKEDIMRVLCFFFPKAFHEYGLFERSLNATFVALIPNEVGLWM